MADWSLPVLGTEYTQWKQALNGRLVDAALMFDSGSTAAINIPTGAKRWNSSASKFEKFDGTSWSDLSTLYAISINGNAATATKLATPIRIGGVSFDGSASISLPGVNAPGNRNTSGYANAAKYVYNGANPASIPMTFQQVDVGQNGGYLWCRSGTDDSIQQLILSSNLHVGSADNASNANAAKYVYNGADPASVGLLFQMADVGQTQGYIWCRSATDESVQQLLHSSVLQVGYAVNAGSAVNATNARYLTTCVGGDIGSVVDSYGFHTAIGGGLYYIQGYGGRWRIISSSNLFQRFD